MIERMLIVDKGGLPLYSRKFVETEDIEPSLLAGLVSAIDSMGYTLFKKKIATISFGDDTLSSLGETISKIVFISKDISRLDKNFYFVFFCNGDDSLKIMRQISTRIFIEIKSHLQTEITDSAILSRRVDRVLENNFMNFIEGK